MASDSSAGALPVDVPAPELSPVRGEAAPALPQAETRIYETNPYVGSWLYASPNGAREIGLYPPEFIELRITEQGGMLAGSYRARYRVSDRLIPPDIAFEFRGRAGGDPATLAWHGKSGSRGELTLKTLTPASMEVSWHVTEFGAGPALGAGTAVLIRKVE